MDLDHVEKEKSPSTLLDSIAGSMNQTYETDNKRKNSF